MLFALVLNICFQTAKWGKSILLREGVINRPQTRGCLGTTLYIGVTSESWCTWSAAHALQTVNELVPVVQRG